MRVLIAEDDEVLADGLARYLQQAGYGTERVANGAHADSLLSTEEFDLVILDIGMPGLDGFEVLRRLRARRREIAVLILTARDAVEDRVRGLDLGADDYLVKPFALVELEARLRAIVRRGQPMENANVSYGALTLNLDAKRAWLKGEPIRLTAREWRILEFLILRAGKMVSKDQIVSALSGADDELSYSAIEVHISHLRQKIEPGGLRIRSIRGFGYYLET